MDKFYTPSHIALSILSHVSNSNPFAIADFSAGNGDLLAAAAVKWPASSFIANDFDCLTVRNLKIRFPAWAICQCDFLKPKCQNGSNVLRSMKSSVDLILLNPPFSCRGGTKHCIQIGQRVIACSTALAFTIEALKYLHENGELLAILPAGTLTNEKDYEAWNYIFNSYSVQTIESYSRRTFSGCFPNTVLIKVSKINVPFTRTIRSPQTSALLSIFNVVRGTQQVH